MRLALVCAAVAGMVAASSAAQAQHMNYDPNLRGSYQPVRGGVRDLSDIPAPIPIPSANPVPEGFSYYLRADLAYGISGSPGFRENGRAYGAGANPYSAASSFGFGSSRFSGLSDETENTFTGGIGFGAYFTPMLRGDITLEFRGDRATEMRGTYSYTSNAGGNPTISGTVQDNFKVQSTVALVNGYIDLLPRGRFSPYIGAGIGLAYNQYNRSYLDTETSSNGAGPQTAQGSASNNGVGLAAALMGGVTFAFDHRWAIDLNYRALYLQGGNATLTTTGLSSNQISTASIGDSWEHQFRAGLRFNIW